MVKHLSIFFWLFLCSVGMASAKDYEAYHKAVNQAEYYLTHKQPDSALYYYDQAFDGYDFIFAKDALIAAQIAWKQKSADRTGTYLIKGAASGLLSKCIDECPILASFMNSTAYEPVYFAMKEANSHFNQGLDLASRQEWDERYDAQVLALSANETAEFIDAVRRNVKRIRELLRSGQYPGEQRIGLGDDCSLENTDAFFCLANYESIISELHDSLWAAVKRGSLHPREFARLWEWEYVTAAKRMDVVNSVVSGHIMHHKIRLQAKPNLYLEINPQYKTTARPLKRFGLLLDINDLSSTDINQNRIAYWLCSLETDALKKQLEIQEGYKLFFGNK